MKRKLLLLTLLIGFAFWVAGCSSSSSEVKSDEKPQAPVTLGENDFEIGQNDDNTLTIEKYTGTAKNIVIPSAIHGLKVTVITSYAFRGKGLTGVVIPDTVHTIGAEAFAGNPALTKVTLGNGVKVIGDKSFARTALRSVVIPNSVTDIGNEAFYSGNIGGGAIKEITFGKSVRFIGVNAFGANQIRELTLPASLREILMGTFSGNRIEALIIPDGVTVIRSRPASVSFEQQFSEAIVASFGGGGGQTTGAFKDNKIEYLSIPASLAKRTDNYQGETTAGIADGTFANNKELTCIVLPAGMDDRAMAGNFEDALVNFWRNQNRAAGAYMKRGPIWTKVTDDEANKFLQEIKK